MMRPWANLRRTPCASAPLTWKAPAPRTATRKPSSKLPLVPLTADLKPDMRQAFTTLLNPQRPIPKRPWISPGITDAVVQNAPFLYQVGPNIAELVNGAYLLGHNVRVDWRLLCRKFPELRPTGLLDTLRLARDHHGKSGNGLGALLDRYNLTGDVTAQVPGGQAHRALWDTVACALLLARLQTEMQIHSTDQFVASARIPLSTQMTTATPAPTLFD